jgi:hypothetical protein
MRKLIAVLGILLAIPQAIFAQDSIHNSAGAANISKLKADVTKRHYGIYASIAASYNPAGVFLPIPDAGGLGGSTTYSFSNIAKSPGGSGSGGVEFLSKETWRWYRTFSIGFSYYSYTCNATQTATQYIHSTGNFSSSQSNSNNSYDYTMIDLSFRNYLRIIESHTQRLGVGFGATISPDIHSNTESIPASDDIPIMSLFISGNLRYDISIASDETIAIEPYYNYEVRSVAQTYPRLASAGLKLSLLFN